jgi:hypothetical protein
VHLLVAKRFDVVGVGWTAPIAFPLRPSGLQFEAT